MLPRVKRRKKIGKGEASADITRTGDRRACSALMFRRLTDWTKCACSLLSFIGSGYIEFDNNASKGKQLFSMYL